MPDLFPLVLDIAADRALVVRLDESHYRNASFLDERLLAEVGPGRWTPWAEIEAAATLLSSSSDFIFHIGHVGSTLLSRLLGVSRKIFSLREPAILRTLANSAAASDTPPRSARAKNSERLETTIRLLARVYHPTQKTLVKATSFVSEMATLLLSHSPSSRAILMTVSPATYIATVLGGPNSRARLPILAAARLPRLLRRLGGAHWRSTDFSEGELAAMSWVCEMSGLAEAAARFPERGAWLDFEAFLDAPGDALAKMLSHLHGQFDPMEVSAMLRSGHLARYSKAPEYAYDAETRRHLLAVAAIEHAAEIKRGMAWLGRAADSHPFLETVRNSAPPKGLGW